MKNDELERIVKDAKMEIDKNYITILEYMESRACFIADVALENSTLNDEYVEILKVANSIRKIIRIRTETKRNPNEDTRYEVKVTQSGTQPKSSYTLIAENYVDARLIAAAINSSVNAKAEIISHYPEAEIEEITSIMKGIASPDISSRSALRLESDRIIISVEAKPEIIDGRAVLSEGDTVFNIDTSVNLNTDMEYGVAVYRLQGEEHD